MTDYSLQALSILCDPTQFKWYIIPVLLVVLFVYTKEMAARNWSAVLAGLAFWGMDWFNEIWNALVLYFTQYAPVWCAPGGGTSYLILVGLNIEITFMFLIMGLMSTLLLPQDKGTKILGINNRLLIAAVMSVLCVAVEMVLNLAGALTWDYSWWSLGSPWLIWLIGYMPFWLVAFWIHDMADTRKQIIAAGAILGFDIVCLVVFGGVLGWI
ncbi:MAG: hypothetical protein JRE40_07085 [Deltaproteobacteria bacterium]|nr:hypothetical protein [Deltaproteobacteria bacterium]MBW2674213.1 hypothetical protein [Deltaproteobacteria bacterium]